MKSKLIAMLTTVTMFFYFIIPSFAADCIAEINCSNEKTAQELAYNYEQRGYRVEIHKIHYGHYQIRAYDPANDIPKPSMFGSMEETQLVYIHYFNTPKEANEYVKKMYQNGLEAHIDDEAMHSSDGNIKWYYRVYVYAHI